MNEILGPMYYCMASNPDASWAAHAEADAFFCFTMLMSEIRDVFIKTLDDSAMGIGAWLLAEGERQPGGRMVVRSRTRRALPAPLHPSLRPWLALQAP